MLDKSNQICYDANTNKQSDSVAASNDKYERDIMQDTIAKFNWAALTASN
jgi:hypothetical protein